MAVSARNFPFEVGDRVVLDLGWEEEGVITKINDGPVVDSVEVEFEAGDFGDYAPEQIVRRA